MAITQDYCDYATGNDYKGATFVDGAFTVADMTLTKAGAFAASKANHWLYLDDNGSNNVTPGYYKIASVTSDDAVVLAASPKSGATDPTDVVCTQHDGTTTLPWRSVQGALDLTAINTTDGNQINVKAGTAQVNAAALVLTTFGSPNNAYKLTIRGYTAAANDGGIGEIDCGGAIMFAAANNHINLVDLECHTFGDNHGITMGSECLLFRCEIHKGASTPTNKHLVVMGQHAVVIGCYLHDSGAGADSQSIRLPNMGFYAANNYIVSPCFGIQAQSATGVVSNNIIVNTATQGVGIRIVTGTEATCCINNICYNTTAGTAAGIDLGSTGYPVGAVLNNIICGYSGAGGAGIRGVDTLLLNHNAFYNNTTNEIVTDQAWIPFTDGNVSLAADPFTDAANGDFSLTAAAKTALGSLGWPASYLGAHANTDPHITIGAIQLAATAADYPAPADVEFGVTYDSGGQTGTLVVPAEADVRDGTDYGAAAEHTGTLDLPAVADVQSGVTYDGATKTGTLVVPAEADVEFGVDYGAAAEYTGAFVVPAEADVQSAVQYGAGGTEFTGTFTEPGVGNVEAGVTYGGGGSEYTGTFAVPAEADVKLATGYGAAGTEFTGTYTPPAADYPAVTDVRDGVLFDTGGQEGTLDLPAVADVELGVQFDNTTKTGTFAPPAVTDVKLGVTYGAAAEFTGTYETVNTANLITTGNVTTIQGDDYDSADGRQLDWTVSSTATLTGGTVAVILPGVDTYAGSVTSETNVRLTLTAAQTAAIPVGRRHYQVIVTQAVGSGSDVITVVEGTWTSKARVSE